MDISKIPDNSLVLCPSALKKELVQELSDTCPEKSLKFLSKEELLEGLTFTYDLSAVWYLHRNKDYSLANSEEILRNLSLITKASDEKLAQLLAFKDELSQQGLLKTNPLFPLLFKGKNVFVLGYSRKDKEIPLLLNRIGVSFTYPEEEASVFYPHEVLDFASLNDELGYVFDQIGALVEKKVPFSHIFFYNPGKDYQLPLEKMAKSYGYPIAFPERFSLYDSPIYQRFVTLLGSSDVENAYNQLSLETASDTYHALDKLVSVLSKLAPLGLSGDDYQELLTYEAKKTALSSPEADNESISFVDSSFEATPLDYVFMLGFSLGTYPVVSQDTDFLSDKEKASLGLNDAATLSAISEEDVSLLIQSTKNLIITYKAKLDKQVFYPSLLVLKLGLSEKAGDRGLDRYSLEYTRREVAIQKDQFSDYSLVLPVLNFYTDQELGYRSYDHHFKPIEGYDDQAKLVLSYSQINEYNTCPFQYFVKRTLKANVFEDTFGSSLGSLFHQILQDSVTKEIHLEDYQPAIDKTFVTAKDKFFISMLLPQVLDVINKNKEFLKTSLYTTIEAEKEVNIQLDDHTYFTGRLDKEMIDTANKSLVIVDYKTDDTELELSKNHDKNQVGLGLQLPLYAFVANTLYPDYTLTGLYIQNVLMKPLDLQTSTCPYDLRGMTLNNVERVKAFDGTLGTRLDPETGKVLKGSAYVSGLSLTDNTLGSGRNRGGILSAQDFADLLTLTKEQIKKTTDSIRQGNFVIAPKVFGNGRLPCLYCPCKDICFTTPDDIVTIIPSTPAQDEGDDEEEEA